MDDTLKQAGDALDKAIQQSVIDHTYRKEREYLVKTVSSDLVSTFKPFLEEIAANTRINKEEIRKALSEVSVAQPVIPPFPDIPPIVVPPIEIPPFPEVKLPTINIPEIKVPEAKVTVTVPEIKVPEAHVSVEIPPIKIPKLEWPRENMPIEGWVRLMGVDVSHPLPVQLRDAQGSPVSFPTMAGGGGVARTVDIGNVLSNVPVTSGATLDVKQVSGANWSVDIAAQSISLITDQLSGANWSVFSTNPIGSGDTATALRTVLAGDSIYSVQITSQPTTFDIKQVSGSVDSVYVNNPVGQGDSATALRIIQAGDSVSSVYVNNPVAQGDSATALRVIHAGDAVASVYANNPFGQGDTATALRVVQAGDSAASVTATQSGTWAQNITQLAGTPLPVGDELITPGQLRVYHVANAGVSVYVRPQAVGFETTNDVLRVLQVSDSVLSSQARGIAMTTNPTAAADAAITFVKTDKIGRPVMVPYQVRDLISTAFISLATSAGYNTETTLIATGAAGVFNDILSISGTNDSTVAAIFDLRCGTANANISKRISLPASANGIYHEDFNIPLLGEVQTPWTVKAFISGGGAADVTGNKVSLHVSYVKNT